MYIESRFSIYKFLVCIRIVDEIYGLIYSKSIILNQEFSHFINYPINQEFVDLFFFHYRIFLSKLIALVDP